MPKEVTPEALCKTCGRSNPALNGLGVILNIPEGNYRLLELFMLRALDDVKCDGCNTELGVSPTVVFVGSRPNVLAYTLGTRMVEGRAALNDELSQLVAKLGPETVLQEYASHSALRDAIINHLRLRLELLKSLVEAKVSGSTSDWMQAHLDELGSSFFAFAHIACTVPQIRIQGYRSSDGTVLTRDELLESFGEDQSASWVALLQAWAGTATKRNLEKDLKTHIEPGVLLTGAAARSIELLGKLLTSRKWPPIVEYVGHAIVASLAAAIGEENLYAATWACHFFRVEMMRASTTDPEEQAELNRLIVSADRAKQTVRFQSAWDVVLGYVADPVDGKGVAIFSKPVNPDVIRQLQAICEKAGHPNLVEQITRSMHVTSFEGKDLSLVLGVIDNSAAKVDDNWELLAMVAPIVRPLIEASNHEAIIQVAEHIIEKRGRVDVVRADVETWLGTQLKLMRKPRIFLERIADKPREWEFNLPADVRVKLWTERSNALRILGRQSEALAIIEQVVQDLPNDIGTHNGWVVLRNRAILLRETGRWDEAIRQLEELTHGASGEDLIATLDSLSVSYAHAGQYDAAMISLSRALQIAKGPLATLAPKLRAQYALVLVILDKVKEGIQELTNLGPTLDSMSLMAAASAWTNILNSNYELSAEERKSIVKITDLVADLIPRMRDSGDFQSYFDCLRLFGGMLEAGGQHDGAHKVWELIYTECSELDQPRSYYELTALALHAYENGNSEKGRAYLLEIPAAVANELGATADLGIASQGVTPKLRSRMGDLTKAVVEHASSFDDVRLASELQRDVVGRAQYLRQVGGEEIERLKFGVGAAEISTIANGKYPVAVLECIAPKGLFGCFVSVISPDGKLRSSYLEQPTFSLEELAEKIRLRLNNWYEGRRGDPFDFAEWKACEDWLCQELSARLGEDGHLVVIEHEVHLGIPWHVAARRWTCSYATSWSSLLTLRKAAAPQRPITIAQIVVPKSLEGEEVVTAMRNSAVRTRAYAKQRGFHLIEEKDERRVDRKRFEQIIRSPNVAKLLCHGFIDVQEHQVALLLANNGELPLLSAGSRSAAARAHRFTWEHCLALKSAPVTVFSAACSSGVSHILGMGERLGLFSGMRRAGTRAFVAPKWDLVARPVLPILDAALEDYLSGEALAIAVHRACKQAETHCPVWQAWNLIVEGNWDEHV